MNLRLLSAVAAFCPSAASAGLSAGAPALSADGHFATVQVSTTQQPPAPAEAAPAAPRRPQPPVGSVGGALPPIGGSPQAAMIARLRTRENV